MPNFAPHLPAEIVAEILHFARLPVPTRALPRPPSSRKYPVEPGVGEIADRTCTLCPLANLRNWSLVNKMWNAVATKLLYTDLDLHMLAIPGRTCPRPVITKFRTESGWVDLVLWASPSKSEVLAQGAPDTPSRLEFSTSAMIGVRPVVPGADDVKLIESTSQMLWYQRPFDELHAADPDRQYVIEYRYIENSANIDQGSGHEDNKSLPVEYKTLYIPAPIRLPRDCCNPDREHHNFFPEWYSLGHYWHDNVGYWGAYRESQWNPLTNYLFHGLFRPLIRTLTARPDLAAMVRCIQLPLIFNDGFMLRSSLRRDFCKADDNIEYEILAEPSDPAAYERDIYTALLNMIVNLTALCDNLEELKSN
ncbi:hypothetical protein DFH27DRAFT_646026 [Peziza echinospora]|nr:hypothetical protein DFH27DRAFT_646026 [Peziza echinospora]